MEAELFEVKMENIDETLQPLLPIPFLIFLLSLLSFFSFPPSSKNLFRYHLSVLENLLPNFPAYPS